MVKEMPEFVEYGIGFVVSQEGGFAIDGGGHVSAHQAEMRASGGAVLTGGSHFEVVHPCPGALVRARVPIRIERAKVLLVLGIEHFIEFDFGMPNVDGFAVVSLDQVDRFSVVRSRSFFDPEAEDFRYERKHAREYGIDGQVGTHVFFVEVVLLLHLLFRPVTVFPWLEQFGRLPCFLCLEGDQLVVFALKSIGGLVFEVGDKLVRPGSGTGHPSLKHDVRIVFFAQKQGLFLPEFKDFSDQIGVVPVFRPSDLG